MYNMFPNLMWIIILYIKEGEQTPSGKNAKRVTPRHIIVKMLRLNMKRKFEISQRKMTREPQ